MAFVKKTRKWEATQGVAFLFSCYTKNHLNANGFQLNCRSLFYRLRKKRV